MHLLLIMLAVKVNAGQMLAIPSDLKATYEIIQVSGTKNRPILETKRSSPSGDSYAIREFDCKTKKTRYLADSSTREGLKSSKPEEGMGPIMENSIAWYQYKFVCKK